MELIGNLTAKSLPYHVDKHMLDENGRMVWARMAIFATEDEVKEWARIVIPKHSEIKILHLEYKDVTEEFGDLYSHE